MKKVKENPDAFKHRYGPELLKRMSNAIHAVHPAFDRKHFQSLMGELAKLEMKPRVRLLREELKKQLPKDFPRALKILLKSTRKGALESFDLWPYSDFIQTFGLEDVELSLDALRELTPLFSSEFAIRPFLIRHPARTLKYLIHCARDPNVNVRRWASEGSRPRLPWGERLHEFVRDPSPTLKILELLKHDTELYVRKSVSNHLNDIAKDHPERVIQVLTKWRKSAGAEHSRKLEWITHRALRTLIKAGHTGALKLIGVSSEAQVSLTGLELGNKSYRIGERIEFEFMIRSRSVKPQKLVVDYIVHFVKARGGTSPKVFKLKTLHLPAGREAVIGKSHHLKAVTTRAHFPGEHLLEIQVNGRVRGRAKWRLSN